MEYIQIGRIVNTHGIKGELKIISDFKYKNKVFIKNFNIYIGKNKIKEQIVTYRKHKNFDMITLNGYNNINEVLKYKNLLVYAKKEDIKLDPKCYLNEDIIGLTAIVDKKEIGTVTDIIKNGGGELLVINNKTLIPYYDEFIYEININNKTIHLKNIEGLFNLW